ncbi:MAG: saccharopine dehydrogenase NADP-binding domain-containing protein [Thermoflexales bacterium]|nr:saccharopine dehydrogenase NADP-binding domain-containing protein [Thermoflexales bacterium]
MARILVLGAGLVARPLVQYLLDQPDFQVTVASRTVEKAHALIGDRPNGEALAFDIEREPERLDALVAQADLAVSMLPYIHHLQVAQACLHHRRHLVTTSYVKDEMRALDGAAREAGVIFLNEIGLDPGIDHMSAMRVIDRVHAGGGQVVAFRSYCGGLPAPEANTNPFGYKFSWSPRGVLLAGRNDARYLEDGRVVEVPNRHLFATRHPVPVEGVGILEAYPNRDSLPYIQLYGIPEARTMYRGTLRYPGWCETWQKFVELGLLDLTERDDLAGMTYRQLLAHLIGRPQTSDLRRDLAVHLNLPEDSPVLDRFEWLGLLSDDPLPPQRTILDVLAVRMQEKLQYAPGERDMVVLLHDFLAEYPDRRERIRSWLVDFGIPHGDTAMARTVGLPAAIATRLILQGVIPLTGVHIPVLPEIYRPVLAELEERGIRVEEQVEQL